MTTIHSRFWIVLLALGAWLALSVQASHGQAPDHRTVIAVDFDATQLKAPYIAAKDGIKAGLEEIVVNNLRARYSPIRWETSKTEAKVGGKLRFKLQMNMLLVQVTHQCSFQLGEGAPRRLSFADGVYDTGNQIPTLPEAQPKLLQAARSFFNSRIPPDITTETEDKWFQHFFREVPLSKEFAIVKPQLVLRVPQSLICAAETSEILLEVRPQMRTGTIHFKPLQATEEEADTICNFSRYKTSQPDGESEGNRWDKHLEDFLAREATLTVKLLTYVRGGTRQNPTFDERADQ